MITSRNILAGMLTLGLTATVACEKKDTGAVTTTSEGGVETAPSAAGVEERDNALIRVVHAVPGASAVAVYAGDSLAFPSVAYKTVTDFKEIGDDYFGFSVVPAGSGKDSPIAENREKLDAIVEQLLIHETLDEAEVYAAAGLPPRAAPPKPQLTPVIR